MNSIPALYQTIDALHDPEKMLAQVSALPGEDARALVLWALGRSMYQFNWSLVAVNLGIPHTDWPPRPPFALKKDIKL